MIYQTSKVSPFYIAFYGYLIERSNTSTTSNQSDRLVLLVDLLVRLIHNNFAQSLVGEETEWSSDTDLIADLFNHVNERFLNIDLH